VRRARALLYLEKTSGVMGLLVDDFHGGFTRYLSAAQAL
jgi:hypothetical protein